MNSVRRIFRMCAYLHVNLSQVSQLPECYLLYVDKKYTELQNCSSMAVQAMTEAL